jgi:non-ribosomal peptide synthetase component F
LSAETVAALRQVCRSQNATVFVAMLAGFMSLLHMYTGEPDILIGTPVSNRDREEFEGLIGLFLNTIVIRANLSANPTFNEIVQHVRRCALEAFDHQNVPFEKIVEELGVEREAGRNPIFQVWFVMQSGAREAASLPGLTISPLDVRPDTTLFDLMLDIEEQRGELSGFIRFNDEIYNVKSIERMARRFETLIDQLASSPSSRLNEIEIDAGQEHKEPGLYFSEDLEAELDF